MINNKLKIKVDIDEKTQVLDIDRESEEIIREAAKRINSMLFEYKKNLRLDDVNDYLRLVALSFATKTVEYERIEEEDTINKKMKNLESKLSEYLKQED